MSEKKREKGFDEFCRSRLTRTAANGEKWPQLSEKSCHNTVQARSPSPRETVGLSCRRSDITCRHPLLSGSSRTNDLRTGVKHGSHDVVSAEKRKVYHSVQDVTKKSFFPGIPPQVVTRADPPFPATETQPLPPINLPKGQDSVMNPSLKKGRDNRPFTILGQLPFENINAYDIAFAAGEERASKRKLESLKRVEEQERHRSTYNVSRQQQKDENSKGGKKKRAGTKRGKNGLRQFTKPLCWKSPWPVEDSVDMSGMDTDHTDMN